MQLAVHQPEFMPWPGFFYKMALADLYIVFDHVQFKKRYFENRNLIVSPKGEVSYVGVPVVTKGRYVQSINNVVIDNTQRWQSIILKKIRHYYSKADYFEKYFEELNILIIKKKYHYLIDLNMELINFFRKHLGISTPITYSSAMDLEGFKGSDLILEICRLKMARIYLCGSSGRDYLVLDDFERNKVNVKWLDYKSPVYKQTLKGFVPNMSTLDLLFNHGQKSLDIILNRQNKEGRTYDYSRA